ncbi:hypothetical protein N431DRAFT_425712 [Stipitochalara longipes BDJ]|nr:hypothetical protein N431DRAFT_425712 [Stipitochalara longipes BDJ]
MSRNERARNCGGEVLHLFDTRNIYAFLFKLSMMLSVLLWRVQFGKGRNRGERSGEK